MQKSAKSLKINLILRHFLFSHSDFKISGVKLSYLLKNPTQNLQKV